MGFEVHLTTPAVALEADRELYMDASRTKLLEAGDPDAAFLVVSHAGKLIPGEIVAELGLSVDGKGKVRQGAAATKDKKEPAKTKEKK